MNVFDEAIVKLKKDIVDLKLLRGTHDQQMRTRTIWIFMRNRGGDRSTTVTQRFLEYCIGELEHELFCLQRDTEDEE